MKRITREALQRFRRGRDFLQQTVVVTALGPITSLVTELTEVIDRITALVIQQDGSNRAAGSRTRSARDQARGLRRKYLRPMSQFARKLFANESGIPESFQMPTVDDYEGLIGAARAMAEQAALHTPRFVEAGFGEAFGERVLAAANTLQKTLDERDNAAANRAAAVAGMEALVKQGGKVLRLLDLLVTSEWADSPEQLAKWKSLTRIDRVAKEEEVTAPDVSVPTAPVGAVPQAAPTVGNISPPVVPVSTEVTAQPKVA